MAQCLPGYLREQRGGAERGRGPGFGTNQRDPKRVESVGHLLAKPANVLLDNFSFNQAQIRDDV